MDLVYAMPNEQHRLFVNFIHACPNACYFCVDFKGDRFFGFNLKNGRRPTANQIIESVEDYPLKNLVTEVFFCGIGEPLISYNTVIEVAQRIRVVFDNNIRLGINTSGTYFYKIKKVDFASYFDLIQVSLNAENEEKYNQICQPKFDGAFQTVMEFLKALKTYTIRKNTKCQVELSVVDTSEVEFLPTAIKHDSNIPQPDIEKCQQIAARFAWPLKVKKLIRDCEDTKWNDFAKDLKKRELDIGSV